jgi:hypothetical protein
MGGRLPKTPREEAPLAGKIATIPLIAVLAVVDTVFALFLAAANAHFSGGRSLYYYLTRVVWDRVYADHEGHYGDPSIAPPQSPAAWPKKRTKKRTKRTGPRRWALKNESKAPLKVTYTDSGDIKSKTLGPGKTLKLTTDEDGISYTLRQGDRKKTGIAKPRRGTTLRTVWE